MNKSIIMGRITHDLELKTTPSGLSVVSFTVAVGRKYKDQNGEQITDFIDCVAWRQTAEFICRNFAKGRMIALTGSIQTRAYTTQTGEKRKATEISVEEVEFTGEKKSEQAPIQQEAPPKDELADLGFEPITGSMNDLPF